MNANVERHRSHDWYHTDRSGTRVLVTGHSGFIGSWLSIALTASGAEVVGFAANDTPHTRRRATELAGLGVTGVTGDIRDFAALHEVMADGRFDAVVHLAAQPLVSAGLSDPRTTLTTNIVGSVNVLEAARLCAPPVLVHVTSDKCYRNREWPWPYREVDELGGGCPYSVSKAGAELVFEGYQDLYRAAGLPLAAGSIRFGNVIGGGDHAVNRLVPDALTALAAGEPIRLRHPDAVRPWQHALDVVHGLLRLVDGLGAGVVAGGQVFNFAPPGNGASVRELVSALTAAWARHGGTGVPVVVEHDPTFAEHGVLRLDGRRAATALGWQHRLDLDGAADAIVGWHRAVAAGVPAVEATAGQLHSLLGLPRLPGRPAVADRTAGAAR
ncbi:CDP-glucose 4,6-dehydratase [Micromonospora sp. NPDC092111]|uniref:CDP-glucose 4,6-dehydratase n=1 Tax=Micromonospora sp. NPDC092111 TaxID=3364289 RepID=UPI0037FA86EA